MRAVLDPNVIISGLLSPTGSPAALLRAWINGAYELVVSPLLLEELARSLGYPKLAARVTPDEVQELVGLLRHEADLREDPGGLPPVQSSDPGDDYLLALAAAAQAVIVSGDRHLLELRGAAPVYGAAEFLAMIEEG
ncbi:MAG: putative toxin-antitoxin system toxin component, PIN family [Acidimicrobiales bacterium]